MEIHLGLQIAARMRMEMTTEGEIASLRFFRAISPRKKPQRKIRATLSRFMPEKAEAGGGRNRILESSAMKDSAAEPRTNGAQDGAPATGDDCSEKHPQ
jgi:hypothetical protein